MQYADGDRRDARARGKAARVKSTAIHERTKRPILFSIEMVHAILEGRKTQTRRVVKPQPADDGEVLWPSGDSHIEWEDVVDNPEYYARCGYCPQGQPGDRLWVRESAVITQPYSPDHTGPWATFKDGSQIDHAGKLWRPDTSLAHEWWKTQGHKLTPAIHVPRWASRISLEIAKVRVERLQQISEEDATDEGVEYNGATHYWRSYDLRGQNPFCSRSAVASFRSLWDSINKKRGLGWDSNPWVWVIQFGIVKAAAA
jgi:hypothetical protein